MAIIETVVGKWIDGRTDLVSRRSDAGKKLHKTGTDEVYDEAVDLASAGYEYEEVDE